MGDYEVIIDHGAHGGAIHALDFVNFVRGPEAIEKMDERNPAFQSGRLSDQGKVHDLLYAGRTKHGVASAAARHHVRVVTEDG